MKQFILLFLIILSATAVAQQTDFVDFKAANALLGVNVDSSKIGGKVWYSLDIVKPVDSIYINAVNMEIDNVEIKFNKSDKQSVKYHYNGKKLWIIDGFKEGKSYTVYFDYSVKPKKALYFVKKDEDIQIWTQGQGKYTSNWLPSIDDVNDKIVFNISLTFDDQYKVISNGLQTLSIPLPGLIKWHFQMQKPMSSYLVALVIGKYDKKIEYSKSGVPLEMYYYPEDSLKFEPTYRYTKQMFDFLEEEIEFPYPWQNYKQIPVHDFLYGGMENTSATIFTDAYVVDEIAFIDKNYVNVNAHELAHQWFGDLVTAKSSKHHWLQEGFATYYALLAEKNIFGADYFYWKLFEYAQELQLQENEGKGTSLLNPKSSSTTFYKKGAFALYMLREYVGDAVFKLAVKNYLIKHQYKNVTTQDFISEVSALSGEDLTEFVSVWLNSNVFPYDGVIDHLSHKSKLISSYLIVDCEAMNSKCLDYINPDFPYQVQSKVISQISDRIVSKVFKTYDLKVRQALATHISKIPLELKVEYESLLKDKSYITIEVALYNLWTNFENERSKYLDKTKGVIGFNDKNIRILWLTLALMTQDYNEDYKTDYFNELVGYTSPKYNFQVRQNAFSYLKMIDACNEECRENLKDATKHHNWRLSKFAKQMLSEF